MTMHQKAVLHPKSHRPTTTGMFWSSCPNNRFPVPQNLACGTWGHRLHPHDPGPVNLLPAAPGRVLTAVGEAAAPPETSRQVRLTEYPRPVLSQPPRLQEFEIMQQ